MIYCDTQTTSGVVDTSTIHPPQDTLELPSVPIAPMEATPRKDRKRNQQTQKVYCVHKDRHHYAKGRCSECYRRGAQVDKMTQSWKEEYGKKAGGGFEAAAKVVIEDWKAGRITSSSLQFSQYLNTSLQPLALPSSSSSSSPPSPSPAYSLLSNFIKTPVLSPTAFKAQQQNSISINNINNNSSNNNNNMSSSTPPSSAIGAAGSTLVVYSQMSMEASPAEIPINEIANQNDSVIESRSSDELSGSKRKTSEGENDLEDELFLKS